MKLNGKKIVLICPKFYGYEEKIISELQKQGATVYMIYENIEWVKVSYRIVYVYFPRFKERMIVSYYKKNLEKLLEDMDLFFVIRGSSLTPSIMEWVKKKKRKACRFIMYQWDGVKNNKSILNIVSYFDRVSTFDVEDAKNYGWVYRPLFYIPEFTCSSVKKDIDFLFICALHSNRVKILNELKKTTADKGYSLKKVMVLNKVLYYKYKYIDKKSEVINANNGDLTFKPLSIENSYKLYARSKIVVDYTNKNQTGFTMRTLEAFGNHCKLMTNNRNIIDADFYDERNILIYDEDNLLIPDDFVLSKYHSTSDDLYNRYTLKSWINDLIGD